MSRIHLLCKKGEHLKETVQKSGIWDSGNWVVTADEAQRLIGGTLYLHETKGERSYFGGRITGFRPIVTDDRIQDRMILTFEFLQQARNVAWRPGSGVRHSQLIILD